MDEQESLIAEALHERHVLVRHRDEKEIESGLVGVAAVEPGQLLVLASPGAHQVPSLVSALPRLLSGFLDGIDSVWVGVGGLAESADATEYLAGELDVEIVAPDGGVAAMPGTALYGGHGVGGTGWYAGGAFLGARFPRPEWESWVPDDGLEVAGITAVPVPCGLAIHCEAGFAVPVDQRFPKMVVGAPLPSAAAVAEVLGELPDLPIMIVPATPEVTDQTWLAELAMNLSRDVVFSAGMQVRTRSGAPSTTVPDSGGNRLFRPFPLVLRQNARGGDQRVLDIAAAPPGWQRDGARSYRHTKGGEVVAEVVPSGLVLRAGTAGPVGSAAETAPFDPVGWTLTVGVPGAVVGLPVLTAAEELLTVLPAQQRAIVRVRLAGIPNPEAERALDRRVGLRGPKNPPAKSEVDGRRGFLVAPPESLAGSAPGVAPVVTTSSIPMSTVSGAPPVAQRGNNTEQQVTAPLEPADPQAGSRCPAVNIVAPPPENPPLAEVTPSPAPTTQRHTVAAAGRPLTVPAKPSTAAEQSRFTSAAGESYAEALAIVNAAMATWPSMRADESFGAKADYVAVCMFLGPGDGGAIPVNDALRVGRAGVLEGHVSCLMSGIRRLPTHRRAVLRQGKLNSSPEHVSTPGTVLTEPGFLVGSTELDVTLPGVDLDILIWPTTARRTTELMLARPIDEAVFLAGARFKALAVRTAEGDDEPEGVPTAPRVAALYRELAPGETPSTTELDERDLIVLAKLDDVLARRHRGALRLVEDPEVIDRLTTSLVTWRQEAAAAVAS